MPVITVDGQKVAVPEGTYFTQAVRANAHISLNGTKVLIDVDTLLKDGDVITTDIIVKNFTGKTVQDYLEEHNEDDMNYFVTVNGKQATYGSQLKNGDSIACYMSMVINIQGIAMHILTGPTVRDRLNQLVWHT